MLPRSRGSGQEDGPESGRAGFGRRRFTPRDGSGRAAQARKDTHDQERQEHADKDLQPSWPASLAPPSPATSPLRALSGRWTRATGPLWSGAASAPESRVGRPRARARAALARSCCRCDFVRLPKPTSLL